MEVLGQLADADTALWVLSALVVGVRVMWILARG